jgi:ribosomal protein S15
LNHFFSPADIKAQLEVSKDITLPLAADPNNLIGRPDDAEERARLDSENYVRHEREHQVVQAALERIMDLENGSSKDRLRSNILRNVQYFGRHETDKILPPKPKGTPVPSLKTAKFSNPQTHESDRVKRPEIKRKGPDTGSPEVQIAILTAKIRSLANHLDSRGRKDKVGKRDLRLLVHRRQKLLQYLRRNERGGPRWQRCVETLGLTEGTWHGEISL